MAEGWVLLHKKIISWQWYQDCGAFKLFVHMILKANYQQKTWQGIVINRGEFVTSREKIARETGLTLQQTRTAENKLKSTGELTVKTTNKFTIYTVVNYEDYQPEDLSSTDRATDRATNQQQSNNKPTTTTNEVKEIEEKKESKKEREGARAEKMLFDFIPLDWKAWLIQEKGWPEEVMNDEWANFREYWQNGKGKATKRSEWFTSFKIWMRKQNGIGKANTTLQQTLSFSEQRKMKNQQALEEARKAYEQSN